MNFKKLNAINKNMNISKTYGILKKLKAYLNIVAIFKINSICFSFFFLFFFFLLLYVGLLGFVVVAY